MSNLEYKLNNLYDVIKPFNIKYSLPSEVSTLINSYIQFEFDIELDDFKYLILNSKNIKFGFKNQNDKSDIRVIEADNLICYLDMTKYHERDQPTFAEDMLMTLLPKSKLESLHITCYHVEWEIYDKFHGIPTTLKKLQVPHFFSLDLYKYKKQLNNLEVLIEGQCRENVTLENWQEYVRELYYNCDNDVRYITLLNKIRVLVPTEDEDENDDDERYYCEESGCYCELIDDENNEYGANEDNVENDAEYDGYGDYEYYCNVCKEYFNTDIHKYHDTDLVIGDNDLIKQIDLHVSINNDLTGTARIGNSMIVMRLFKNFTQSKFYSLTDLDLLKNVLVTLKKKLIEILELEAYDAKYKKLACAYKQIADKISLKID